MGKALETDTIELYKKPGGTGKNWIALPPCCPLSSASELMDDIGQAPTVECTVVNRWNSETQESEGWLDIGMGTNFDLVLGEGYEVWVSENTSWIPSC